MSAVRKRSVAIRGHRTSFSIEQDFFDELEKIAAARGVSLAALVAEVDETRSRDANLSSALRVFVFRDLQARNAATQS
jgi:predicted DNA-binding ribbon-helix-helix protein